MAMYNVFGGGGEGGGEEGEERGYIMVSVAREIFTFMKSFCDQ